MARKMIAIVKAKAARKARNNTDLSIDVRKRISGNHSRAEDKAISIET